MNQQQRTKIAIAAAAIAGTVGLGIAIVASDYNDHASAVIEDAGMSRSVGAPRVTDLLTAPVEPGATVKTGVTLPRGARVTDVMPATQFAIESQAHVDHDDRTWYEVVARNQGPAPLRFVAFISFDVPPADGGL